MKHLLLGRTVIGLITFFFPFTLFAWNEVGHMVIANIAYQHVTPIVRKKIDNLVFYFNQEYPQMRTFQHIASWPDTLRAQKIETFTHWHYIDVPFSNDGTPVKNTIDADNVVWAVHKVQAAVKNNQANAYERVRFLAFLAHLVGDLHQPLHTVSLYSAAHPNGDKGGNLYFVQYQHAEQNLHKIWDEGFGEFAVDATPTNISALSVKISSEYGMGSFGQKAFDLDPDHWAHEGMKNAKQYVYTAPEKQLLTTTYVETGKRVVEQEVALAGYRLAIILNKLLG